MCDTMGFVSGGKGFFAKNSDRSPNEAQVTELFPARELSERTLNISGVEVERGGRIYSLLLSRPVWLWGGEMGVNERGVAIGNEAVFTRGRYGKTGLLGMDMLRLALERAATASEAADVIKALLTRYGQGGSGGFDKKFYYDNSYLIVDRRDVLVLETAGREWAQKRYERAAISNRLTLGADADAYSGKACDFAKKHTEPVFTHFSGSRERLASARDCVEGAIGVYDLLRGLRAHEDGAAPLRAGSVKSVCMHAGGLVGDQTTASMAVEIGDEIRAWVTGGSAPCVSLFKPYRLGDPVSAPVFAPNDPAGEAYWREREEFHRSLMGRELPKSYYMERDALEGSWLGDDGDPAELAETAAEEEWAFYSKWMRRLPEKQPVKRSFARYWDKKSEKL